MDLFWIFFLLLCLAWFSFSILTLNFSAAISKLPPGPRPLPVIGNLLDLGDKPHRSLANLAKSHGPIMTLKLGHVTTVVVSSAAMAKEVLQTHDQFLSCRTVPDSMTTHNHQVLGLPWIPVSPLWRKLRRICNTQLFAGRILDGNQNLRRAKVADLVSEITIRASKGEMVDFGKVAFMTSLNLLSNTIFSADFLDPNSEIGKEFKEVVRGIVKEGARPNLGDYFPLLKKLDLQGIKRRQTMNFDKVFNVLEQMMDQRLHQQQASASASAPNNNDLLHYLLNLTHQNSDMKIDKIQIQHLILVLFVAGTDTSSATLQWAMAELLRNPEKLSKVQEETRRVIGIGNPIEESDISRLPYLQAIVKETFRLHAPAPFLLPRKALQDVEIGGFTIPKGAQVLVNAWAMGRDWENPESFEPERFMGSEMDVRGRDFELIPFGGGRRICPGLPLAMRMLHLMLGSLVHLFDWKLEDGCGPEDVNMEEEFGITVEMAFPLRALPLIIP
ncbi:geraniol 8-hydroxylase-like [Momordica charantia]|uniref:Geraniol 8-hydroxylase-like n=1 Tax=Momordica charantia TaxID=3673 RepID=A0A6J1CX67_MOMCH|nr:geraniol 8-hydroxylase-like [Momordica charantia]